MTYATNQTKWLGELRFYANDRNAPGKITNTLHRTVPIDAALPEDPAAVKLLEEARGAIAKARGPAPVSQ